MVKKSFFLRQIMVEWSIPPMAKAIGFLDGDIMKLISKHKDYYDFFARDRSLSDQTYVWDRRTRAMEIDFAIPNVVRYDNRLLFRNDRGWHPDIEMRGFMVWFCGIPVPVVRVDRNAVRHDAFQVREGTTDWFYKLDDVPEDAYGGEPKGKRHKRYLHPYQQLEDLFALGENSDGNVGWEKNKFTVDYPAGRVIPKIDVLGMHLAAKSPVFCHPFVIDEHDSEVTKTIGEIRTGIQKKPCIVVNPRLAAIKFWDRFDAFKAFQMLERYVSNEMAPRDVRMDKPIPDVLKAQTHGFDKMSFRREPQGKRQGRGKA